MKISITCLLVLFVLISCSKNGDPGPAGAQGPAGPAGPTGTQGPKGDTGTANVIYSSWLDVAYEADTLHVDDVVDTIGFHAAITAEKMDSAIVASGEIKVYMNLGTSTDPNVVPLPYLDVYSGVNVSPQFKIKSILLYSNSNVSTLVRNDAKYLQYRYILIPGSVGGRRMNNVDWNNYNQVKAYLKIKD